MVKLNPWTLTWSIILLEQHCILHILSSSHPPSNSTSFSSASCPCQLDVTEVAFQSPLWYYSRTYATADRCSASYEILVHGACKYPRVENIIGNFRFSKNLVGYVVQCMKFWMQGKVRKPQSIGSMSFKHICPDKILEGSSHHTPCLTWHQRIISIDLSHKEVDLFRSSSLARQNEPHGFAWSRWSYNAWKKPCTTIPGIHLKNVVTWIEYIAFKFKVPQLYTRTKSIFECKPSHNVFDPSVRKSIVR